MCIPINSIYLFTCLILIIIYFAEFYCKLYNPPRLALLHAGCIYMYFSNLFNLNYLNKMIEMIEMKKMIEMKMIEMKLKLND